MSMNTQTPLIDPPRSRSGWLRSLVKFSLILTAIVAVLMGAFFWRIAASPLDLSVIKPMVERSLSFPENGVRVQIGDIHLKWAPKERAVFMSASKTRILGRNDQVMMAIENMAMSASFKHLLMGRLRPRVIMIFGPHLVVDRLADGRFDFGFDSAGAPAPANDLNTPEKDDVLAEILGAVGHVGGRSAERGPLSALRRFEIRQADMIVRDHKIGAEWIVPRVDVRFSAFRHQGLRMSADVALGFEGDERNHIRVNAVMPVGQSDFEVQLDVRELSSRYVMNKLPYLDALGDQDLTLDGRVRAKLSSDLQLSSMDVDLESAQGRLDLDIYDGKPLSYTDLIVHARYDAQGGVRISESGVTIEGLPISIAADVKADAAGYDGALRIDVPQMRRENFVQLWPESLHYVGAYSWLSEKISDGLYRDVSAVIDASYHPDAGEVFVFENARVDFAFDAMKIDYRAPMVPITQAKGEGFFDYQSEYLSLDMQSGKAGALDIVRGDVELAHIVESGHGDADVFVVLKGQLADVFGFLEAKPIAFNHGYNKSRILGEAELKVNIGVPTHGHVTMDDVKIDVRGTVKNGQLPHILKTTDLSQVDARVVIDQNAVDVAGKGMFGGQNLRFDYQGFLESEGQPFKEKITVKGRANDDTLDRLDIDLSAFLGGEMGVDAIYTNYGGGKQNVQVKADLGSAHIYSPQLGYDKASGVAAQAELSLDLRHGTARAISGLHVMGPDLLIENGALSFAPKTGMLSGGNAPFMRVGQSYGRVEFSVDADQRYMIDGDMQVYDLRPLLNKDKKNTSQTEDQIALIATLKASELLTHKEQRVRDSQIYADITEEGRFQQLEMDAKVGRGSIYLRYKPNDEGVRVFRFEADDAGATLAAFGLYQQIRGGSILVHAEPLNRLLDGNLIGVAEIKDFRVVEAPTLAKLLSLTSFDGLTSGISEEGIGFSRLETQFDWTYRPGGSLITLQEGRTSGSSIGLTFDGVVDQHAGTIDVSGTIIPVSGVNNMIKSIPVLGDVLTGGSGVFAATYKVKGKANEPEISINPLSVLAPGIIRRVLFE
ncbi:MAG: hypothetical protein CL570_06000 [Alphaproteobacteria bacterium]|nr:hypothetical protein [Alphaproteobacteria bacterium]